MFPNTKNFFEYFGISIIAQATEKFCFRKISFEEEQLTIYSKT